VSAECWLETFIDSAVLSRSHAALQRRVLRLVLADLAHMTAKASPHEHVESIIAQAHNLRRMHLRGKQKSELLGRKPMKTI
jgi:hypothetical protein